MRIRIGVAALAVFASACSGSGDSGTTTTVAVTTSTTTTAPSTTSAPATSQVPTTSAPTTAAPSTTSAAPADLVEFASGADVTLSTSSDCPGLTEPIAAGSITWSDGERIWEGVVEGAATCLFHVDGGISSMEWAPQGDRVLINRRLIVGGPSSGLTAPAQVNWQFTYPTGRNLVGVADGRVVKYRPEQGIEEDLAPISEHSNVAYHPSGLHIAVGGVEQPEDPDFDATEGVFIAQSDGTNAVNLVLGFDVTIRDIRFSNDGSLVYFVAEHDDLVHFHSVGMIPEDIEGTLVLGAGAEEFATTHATSSGGGRVEFSKLLVHPTLPDVAAWTTAECETVGERGFQILVGADASLVQSIGPASAVGFLNSDPSTVIVAALSGSCDGPRDLGLMSVSLDTAEVINAPIAGNVTAAAVRTVAAPHKHDLVGVEIVGFA